MQLTLELKFPGIFEMIRLHFIIFGLNMRLETAKRNGNQRQDKINKAQVANRRSQISLFLRIWLIRWCQKKNDSRVI